MLLKGSAYFVREDGIVVFWRNDCSTDRPELPWWWGAQDVPRAKSINFVGTDFSREGRVKTFQEAQRKALRAADYLALYHRKRKSKSAKTPASGRVLFLDFDGVLHPKRGNSFENCFQHLPSIHKLLDKHQDLKVVVHSDWRGVYTDKELKGFLFKNRLDLAGRFGGATPRKLFRWDSIRTWVDKHPEATQFCILDDDVRLFPKNIVRGKDSRFRFIGCEAAKGLCVEGPSMQNLVGWLTETAPISRSD